jgi:F-box and leucine-rich repeat protein GRR1
LAISGSSFIFTTNNMYTHSPNHSTTSLSDIDDDEMDVNKSVFFPGADQALVVSPAKWSSKFRYLPARVGPLRDSPMSHLPPEILIHILKHLNSPRDLYNSLLVSRAWCECSVELLWHKPTFSKLFTLVKMMRVLSRTDQTFTYAHFIRRLNFLFLGPDITDSLFCRLAQCDRLERLTLVGCTAISEGALSHVLPCCPNLVAIDLTGVIDTSDKVIEALAESAKRLQGINLGGCKNITDKGVMALANHCPLLRRVKLSGVELITDEPISALAKSCPLLLEIDLNNCVKITDLSVRDIWTYSSHMRELRLAHCILTDAAFPAPLTQDKPTTPSILNPFPSSISKLSEQLPPLVLSRSFEHLRMLDLTACALLTDDAIEGVISHAPKIRNLVLSKCTLLTDRTVENICRLGRHIHYLHLGHAASITDRSVRTLARCCTRIRYIDFASVSQISALPHDLLT